MYDKFIYLFNLDDRRGRGCGNPRVWWYQRHRINYNINESGRGREGRERKGGREGRGPTIIKNYYIY